jgi:hypothetical protein
VAKSMISCLRVAGAGTVLVGVLAGTGVANGPVASAAAAAACVSPGGYRRPQFTKARLLAASQELA